MRIAYYSHNIDFAGTWRSHERIIEHVQNMEGVSIDVLYSPDVDNDRLETSKKLLHRCNFIPFRRSKQKTGPESGYAPVENNVEEVVKERNIDLLHFARSGYYEWPFNKRICPIQIETNIFGYEDTSPFTDGTIFIAKCLGFSETNRRILLPNPIPSPSNEYHKIDDLKNDLKIPTGVHVLGRIGRPANFSPISYMAFDAFRKRIPSKYVVIGGCEEAKSFVEKNGMTDDVIFLDCTNDDKFIERFHKTIDVFAHYRSDGEICSTAIAQAMMYGKPVITHFAGRNGQQEWLGNGGICVNDPQEYLNAMVGLTQASIYQQISNAARDFAHFHFSQETISEKVVEFYKNVERQKNCEY